jgi:uncharacterized membrane protein
VVCSRWRAGGAARIEKAESDEERPEMSRLATIFSKAKKLFAQPQNILIAAAILVGVPMAVLTPPSMGFDECEHYWRVSSIVHGGIVSENVGHDIYGGALSKNEAYICNTVKTEMQFNGRFGTFPWWSGNSVSDGVKSDQSADVYWGFSNTAVYNPLNYLAHIMANLFVGSFTSNVKIQFLAMRLAGLALFTTVMFFVIKTNKKFKWLFLTLALFPPIFVLATAITADTMTLVVCFAFLAKLLDSLFDAGKVAKKDIIWLRALTICLGLIKPPYILLVGLLVLLPVLKTDFRSVRKLRPLILSCFTAVSLFLLWYKLVANINTGLYFGRATDPSAQLGFILECPLRYVRLLFESFVFPRFLSTDVYWVDVANRNQEHTITLSVVSVILLAIGVFIGSSAMKFAKIRQNVTFRLICFVMFGVVATAVNTVLWLQFTLPGASYIEGLQTRYYFALFPLLVAFAPTVRLDETDKTKTYMVVALAQMVVLVALLVFAISIWY